MKLKLVPVLKFKMHCTAYEISQYFFASQEQKNNQEIIQHILDFSFPRSKPWQLLYQKLMEKNLISLRI